MTKRLLLVLAVTLVALAGCGDDDDRESSATTEASARTTSSLTPDTHGDLEPLSAEAQAFCSALEPVADIDVDVRFTLDQLDDVTAAADAAPNEDVRAAITLVGELAYGLVGIDLEDEEQVAQAQAATNSPEIVDAATVVADFATEECGFDVPFFSSLADS